MSAQTTAADVKNRVLEIIINATSGMDTWDVRRAAAKIFMPDDQGWSYGDERLAGQVSRALDALAKAGLIFKADKWHRLNRGRPTPRWFSLTEYTKALDAADRAEILAEEREKRAEAAKAALTLHGVRATRDRGTGFHLTLDEAEALVATLEARSGPQDA